MVSAWKNEAHFSSREIYSATSGIFIGKHPTKLFNNVCHKFDVFLMLLFQQSEMFCYREAARLWVTADETSNASMRHSKTLEKCWWKCKVLHREYTYASSCSRGISLKTETLLAARKGSEEEARRHCCRSAYVSRRPRHSTCSFHPISLISSFYKSLSPWVQSTRLSPTQQPKSNIPVQEEATRKKSQQHCFNSLLQSCCFFWIEPEKELNTLSCCKQRTDLYFFFSARLLRTSRKTNQRRFVWKFMERAFQHQSHLILVGMGGGVGRAEDEHSLFWRFSSSRSKCQN